MAEWYPLVEPYAAGMLAVGNGNSVYWNIAGDPDGIPAVMVHGGPGSGCTPQMRNGFDPRRYRSVLFDQRGCGRSTPHASDPATDMRHNTTEHLISDMELLRVHLGFERWLLCGGSWGSTLILAYAQRHPERVSGIVISAVTMTRPVEIDWLYHGVARFFPEEWQRFRALVPEGDLLAGYVRMLEDPDPQVRYRAANAWCAWEDAVLSMEPGRQRDVYSGRPSDDMLAFVRICAHYFANNAWIPDGQLLRGADRLAGIPGVLIHGRLDLGSPVHTAWELAKAWPDAELVVLNDSGHLASESKRDSLLAALDTVAVQLTPRE